MSNNNGGTIMVMMMAMMVFSGMFFSLVSAIGGFLWYKNVYKKDDDTDTSGDNTSGIVGTGGSESPETNSAGEYILVSGDTGKTYKLPTGVINDRSEDCAYLYESGRGGWKEGSEENSLVNGGSWCLADGTGSRMEINSLKRKRHAHESEADRNMKDKLDYIRLGKNVNVTIYKNEGDTTGKTFSGSSYGADKIIDLEDHSGWVNKVQYFKVDKA